MFNIILKHKIYALHGIGGILLLCNSQKIISQNVAPTAVDDSYTIAPNTPTTINSASGLLANDTDPNGNNTLSVQTMPLIDVNSGSLLLNANGSFTYTPNTGFLGTDTFTYRVCDDGTPEEVVSLFDFDTATLTDATVGPNATSINPDAVPIECGLHIPSGSSGGNVGLDLVIPNTGGIFNFTSFTVNFEYRDQESQATLISAGNFSLYHERANDLGLTITVINGVTGLPESIDVALGAFLNGNVPYSVTYSEVTGEVLFNADGTLTTFSVAPPNSPLDNSLATDITVGNSLDNSGRNFASFCSISFVDQSIQCAMADVILTIPGSVITNKRITFRVKN